MDSYIDNAGFYNLNVKNNIYPFDITNLLHNYNDVNEDMINVIKIKFDHLKSIKNISEDQIQNTLNQLLICLFSQFNNSTSLKYLDTSKKGYLNGKAPDCSFIYKNVNIDVKAEHQSLQDFVVCVGELKSSKKSIDAPATVGQLLRYLTYPRTNTRNRIPSGVHKIRLTTHNGSCPIRSDKSRLIPLCSSNIRLPKPLCSHKILVAGA